MAGKTTPKTTTNLFGMGPIKIEKEL